MHRMVSVGVRGQATGCQRRRQGKGCARLTMFPFSAIEIAGLMTLTVIRNGPGTVNNFLVQ